MRESSTTDVDDPLCYKIFIVVSVSVHESSVAFRLITGCIFAVPLTPMLSSSVATSLIGQL